MILPFSAEDLENNSAGIEEEEEENTSKNSSESNNNNNSKEKQLTEEEEEEEERKKAEKQTNRKTVKLNTKAVSDKIFLLQEELRKQKQALFDGENEETNS